MKSDKKTLTGIFAALSMLFIILDGKTAVSSAIDGINMCLKTVIPALFPFFFLSGLLNSYLFGKTIRSITWLERFCRIPAGGASIFLIGLISGYPTGAQLISQTYHSGGLSKKSAQRMLGFCCNAGPAFIFGILSPLFHNPLTPLILWFIHIIGAIRAGRFLPVWNVETRCIQKAYTLTPTQSLQNALRTTATICGWIVIFRILIGFLRRWFLWLLPADVSVFVSGMIELTNGCIMLPTLTNEGTRFILASVMLSLGGLCVIMQTHSVSHELGLGFYFPGKLIQTAISVLLSFLLQPILFYDGNVYHINPVIILLILATTLIGLILSRKKVVDFIKSLLYNNCRKVDLKGESVCYFGKK